VSYGVRCQIQAFLQTEISIPAMAKLLCLHKTTIYREINRNGSRDKYFAKKAQKLTRVRIRRCRRKKIITASLGSKIEGRLVLGWSPEQIAGRLKKENIKTTICPQTIYRYIEEHKPLRSFLRRYDKRGAGRYLQRRNLQRESHLTIDTRPKIANERGRFGDWERDLFYAGNKKQLLVCTDRKSRLTKVTKLERGTGVIVQKETIRLLKNAGGKVFSVTNDNGTEFKQNLPIGVPVYFCKPLKPHQRGTIENTIGLLRQYITRKTDIEKYTEKDIDDIENLINFRPRKCLDYKTPYEVYYNKKVALAV
jgi:IS30 family transposase